MSFQLIDKQKLRRKGNDFKNNNSHAAGYDYYNYNKYFNSNNDLNFNFSDIDIYYKNKFIESKPICSCAGKCPSCNSQNSINMTIQPKLRVNQPEDPTESFYEKEADTFANKIMLMSNNLLIPHITKLRSYRTTLS